MILILCNSFKEVQDSFSRFMDFLEKCEPDHISRVFEYSYGVETDDGLNYLFIDRRIWHWFVNSKPDRIECDKFFEGLEDCYECWR